MTRYLFLFLGLLLPQFTFSEERGRTGCDLNKGDICAPARPVYTSPTILPTPPTYPTKSIRLNEQGTVLLEVLITADGKAGAVEIKKSSGFERLDRAAVEAVKQWKFNAATLDGKPIDRWHLVPITFKLEN
jgi:protein TonB